MVATVTSAELAATVVPEVPVLLVRTVPPVLSVLSTAATAPAVPLEVPVVMVATQVLARLE